MESAREGHFPGPWTSTTAPASPFSLGVEEEFQLLNGESFELSSRFDEVLEAAGGDERIKPELMQSVIEVATHVASNVAEAVEDARGLRRQLRDAAAEGGTLIASRGHAPVLALRAPGRDRPAALPRADRGDAVGRGAGADLRPPRPRGPADARRRRSPSANTLRTWLPELLALSANSPFWHGRDTGLASTRIKIFETFPRSGLPPALASFEEFELLVERGVRTGCFEDYTFIWWDARPHPSLGTIELRICDGQTRLESVAGIVALAQCLVATLAERFERGQAAADPADHARRTRTSGAPRATGSRPT